MGMFPQSCKILRGRVRLTYRLQTIWCSQSCYIPGLTFSIIMKGFCELALSRLDQAATMGVELIDPPAYEEGGTYHDESTRERSSASRSGTPRLQWAARLQTGYEGNLTPKQELGLTELRELLTKTDPEAWDLCKKHPDGPTRAHRRNGSPTTRRRRIRRRSSPQDIRADHILTVEIDVHRITLGWKTKSPQSVSSARFDRAGKIRIDTFNASLRI
jgi:hypothetical protein